MQNGERCWYCGGQIGLERHHVMTGPNRKLAEKYGLWVWVCHDHHTGKDGVQYNRQKADALKRLGQIAFEARHSHDEWMEIFGKNYL